MALQEDRTARWLDNFFEAHAWGKGNGRSMVVVQQLGRYKRGDESKKHLVKSLKEVGEHAEVRYTSEVSVKDLLSCGRVVIERMALQNILSKASKVKPTSAI